MQNSILDRFTRALTPAAARTRLVLMLAVVGLSAAACNSDNTSAPGALTTITVTPNATIAANATVQMVAVGTDASGRVVSISPTWSVANNGGTVSSTGMFTAGSVAGVFNNAVSATVGLISGSATMTVTAGVVSTITVTPSPVTVVAGATQQFVAIAKDASGNAVAFTPAWSIVAGGGTISSTGLFTALATPGTFTNTVQVSGGGVTSLTTVTVVAGALATITLTPTSATLAAGAVQAFTAVGKDALGNTVAITPTWALSAGGGTLSATGSFTAGTIAGTYANTVTATSGVIVGRATVIVSPGAVATVTVTPNPAAVVMNGTVQFVAVARDASNNVVATTIVWNMVNGGGTINATTGLFTAGGTPGVYLNTIQAASGTTLGVASVTVTATAAISGTP